MAPSDKPTSAVYADELSCLNEGHAIWIPEGPNQSEEVQLGDVGYINKDGAFIFLFNVDLCSKEIEARCMERFLPKDMCNYFDFDKIRQFIKTYDNYMKPNLYSSRTVKKRELGGTLEGSVLLCLSLVAGAHR